MTLTFYGATGTVTGSKYLLETATGNLLVDCGLFQGLKQLRLRNREPVPFDLAALDAIVLTHAHLDHTGYLPLLVREGYRGPVYCTPATADLCAVLLPDSGHLQEEEAEIANRYGYSKHHPALPLYTRADAIRCLDQIETVDFDRDRPLFPGVGLRFSRAGHMLGAAMARIRTDRGDILFSGDLGRPADPVLPPPDTIDEADYLLVESTYGDRLHDPSEPLDQIADVVTRTAARGGTVIIPAFAVGRAQTILYYLHQLQDQQRIPRIPLYLDSPMAGSATEVFEKHSAETRLGRDFGRAIAGAVTVVASVEESKRIDRMSVPRVIISASGMATGGRVVHHLKMLASDPRNTILFAGYQAAGTRGATIRAGAESVKIHGQYVPVRAEVAALDNLSAHADYQEILDWLAGFRKPPRTTFITHGEPVAADALRLRIEERLGWHVTVPEYRQTATLFENDGPSPR
jgi:metallo-beta-lactamase family protein